MHSEVSCNSQGRAPFGSIAFYSTTLNSSMATEILKNLKVETDVVVASWQPDKTEGYELKRSSIGYHINSKGAAVMIYYQISGSNNHSESLVGWVKHDVEALAAALEIALSVFNE